MIKVRRQETLKELIKEKRIETQQELVRELKKLGFKTTQTTVSRDISELRVQRVKRNGKYAYTLPEELSPGGEQNRLMNMIRDFVLAILKSRNLVVVKTSPGTAQGVAQALDGQKWEEILGTVAGDDTILVIAKDDRSGSKILKQLEEMRT